MAPHAQSSGAWPGDAPPSVKEITDRANSFEFNVNVDFKFWVQSCKNLRQEANFALREGDYPQAYYMLYRESNIVMNYLHKHPRFRDPGNRKLYKPLLDDLPNVMNRLEALKPIIAEQHDEYKRMTAPETRSSSSAAAPAERRVTRSSTRRSTRVLDAAQNMDLAVDLAREEIRKRGLEKGAGRHPDADDMWKDLGPSHPGRAAESGRNQRVTYQVPTDEYDDKDDLRLQMEEARRNLDAVSSPRPHQERTRLSQPEPPYRSSSLAYPEYTRSKPIDFTEQRTTQAPAGPRPHRPPKETSETSPFFDSSDISSLSRRPPPPTRYDSNTSAVRDRLPPPLPEKTRLAQAEYPRPSEQSTIDGYHQHLPPRPRKKPLDGYDDHEPAPTPPPTLPKKEPIPSLPDNSSTTTPTTPKERISFRPAAYLENGEPLRHIMLPSTLRSAFLDIAAPNTARGLEMCGMLCGTPVNNALFVSCLLIPEQKCTSDTCETVNEGAMLEYCIEEDLLLIGWIHTHPTQSCFMSSRDLHTHAGYQVMMPESIAIVCAPKFEPSYGIFRLTNPPGLPYILNCSNTETFHHHAIDDIYTTALKPAGHVLEHPKLPFKVHDLRP